MLFCTDMSMMSHMNLACCFLRVILELFLNLCLHSAERPRFKPCDCSKALITFVIMASASTFQTGGVPVKFWTPNLGGRVPVDLNTGLPDYNDYLNSGLWCTRRRLRSCGGTGEVAYVPDGDRTWPSHFPVQNMKVYPTFCEMRGVAREEEISPVHLLNVLEGQIALIHHVIKFEEANPTVHVLSPRQKWKATFIAYILGSVSQGALTMLSSMGNEIYNLSISQSSSWPVRTSKSLTYALRHDKKMKLGLFNDATFEDLDRVLQSSKWSPNKILAFLLGNTKARFIVHVQVRKLYYDDIASFDWYLSLSAVQGHTRVNERANPETLGEPLTLSRCKALGFIFHAAHNRNWESIREGGLVLGQTRYEGQSARVAIHFTYAGGQEPPRAGTHIQYGRYMFYCSVDYERFLADGYELYLMENGVVLCRTSVPSKYLSFTLRPPHEKDPGGRRWDRKSKEEGVPLGTGSSEAGAAGSSRSGEVPGASSSSAAGGSRSGEGPADTSGVPTFDFDDLRRVIQEDELRNQTSSEGRRVPTEEGIFEVDGRVSTSRLFVEEQEELIRQVSSNPWYYYYQGITTLKDKNGHLVLSDYGDGRVRTTTWRDLPNDLKKTLSAKGDMMPDTWAAHPFSGFTVHFFLRAFELGKWQGNLRIENIKEFVYTRPNRQGVPVTGYKSHFGPVGDLLYNVQELIEDEFRPDYFMDFLMPTEKDKRYPVPRPDDFSDDHAYQNALQAHLECRREIEAWQEFDYIRKDFSLVVDCVAELYGEDLFSYIRQNAEDLNLRSRFVVPLPSGENIYDCSLKEPFTPQLILAKLKKRFDESDQKSFYSSFGRKAFNDLAEYEHVRARHADSLQDLLDRPFEDILAEEIIDSLPTRTTVEEMEIDPPPASEPAAGSSSLKEEPDAELGGSSLEEVPTAEGGGSSLKEEPLEPTDADEPMGEASAKKPKLDTEETPAESSRSGEASAEIPNIEPADEETRERVSQGIWGNQETYVLPEAFEPMDVDMDAPTSRLSPEKTNADMVEETKAQDEVYAITNCPEYNDNDPNGPWVLEKASPIGILKKQKYGGDFGGFYHDNCRSNRVTHFKLLHMCYRREEVDGRDTLHHPYEKFRTNEYDTFEAMAKLPPVFEGRKGKNDIAFSAGDIRSTYDEDLLEKSSAIAPRCEAIKQQLIERLSSKGGTREQLQNAMLHYFLACSISMDEVGDIAIDEAEEFYRQFVEEERTGARLYQSKDRLSVMVLNLGNFVRGKKNTVPPAYSDHIEELETKPPGIFIKSLARSKSHLILLNEASKITAQDVAYLLRNGWLTWNSPGHDLMVMTRTNYVEDRIVQIAGSNLKPEIHKFLPLSYAIVEIRFGKTPTPETVRKMGSDRRASYDSNFMPDDLERCGMHTIRVCVFHMSSKVANKKPALTHECFGIMLADCFHFQVDIIGGDANMAAYRTGGYKQGSTSFRDSCWQEMVRYFAKSYMAAAGNDPHCRVRPRFMSSNPLTLLRWAEDIFGKPWKEVGAVDWDNAPELDCMVACVLEWAHSYPMDKWQNLRPDAGFEYNISISEWLLHSNKENYLLPTSDTDSHTPLLFHMRPTWMTNQDRRAFLDQDKVKTRHDNRRQAQRAKKASGGATAPIPEGGPGPMHDTAEPFAPKGKGKMGKDKGDTRRPAEPEGPPPGKGKGGQRPAEPAGPPPKGKGKREAYLDEPAKGKKGGQQKGKKGETAKGKFAKGSEKGKTKDKNYGKGKGQK